MPASSNSAVKRSGATASQCPGVPFLLFGGKGFPICKISPTMAFSLPPPSVNKTAKIQRILAVFFRENIFFCGAFFPCLEKDASPAG